MTEAPASSCPTGHVKQTKSAMGLQLVFVFSIFFSSLPQFHALPSLMSAVVPTEQSLEVVSVPLPQMASGDVLIRVHYSAVNRMDLLQARGKYPLPEGTSDILGVEVSGVIVDKHHDTVSDLIIGDEVMALLPGAGYAEYCVSDVRTVMKIPPAIDLKTASAIPEAFMTAYQLLFFVAKIQPNESLLLHAAASSVGQAAIQMAVQKGIRVFVTSRSQEKLSLCMQLGATGGTVVQNDHKFADYVKKLNNDIGIDVILDPVGAAYLEENLKVIRYDGRFVSYGLLSGGIVPDQLNNAESPSFLKQLLFKRLHFLASTLRARSIEYKSDLIEALSNDTLSGFPGINDYKIKVAVSDIYPLHAANEAHALMMDNKNMGKIVLDIASTAQQPQHEL